MVLLNSVEIAPAERVACGRLNHKPVFPARRLEVEITEGSLLEDRAQALIILESLRNHGIAIALDDFGTGYASLSQLHALPFDRIKIDRSFITSLGVNEQAAAIVQTIAALGKALSVPITAEGVATLERLAVASPPIEGVVLRYGHLYGPGTGAAAAGEAPSLHVDAAASAALLAIEKAHGGIYNVAEPNGYLSTENARRVLGFDPSFRLSSHA